MSHKVNNCNHVLISAVRDAFKVFRDIFRFIGPGFMVGLGYMDPGNWATDLSGNDVFMVLSVFLKSIFLLAGSTFGYDLLYIILLANFMAIILQYLCIKLGVVTGKDLAMACRAYFSKNTAFGLFILCELAIIATDLAEVIGTAIALNLLFGLAIHWGVLLTCLDVIFILLFWESKTLRFFEIGIMVLMLSIAMCFFYLVFLCSPNWNHVAHGFVPSADIFTDSNKLYLAMGIMGATIMPHNLYLHSSLVRYRSTDTTLAEKLHVPQSTRKLDTQINFTSATTPSEPNTNSAEPNEPQNENYAVNSESTTAIEIMPVSTPKTITPVQSSNSNLFLQSSSISSTFIEKSANMSIENNSNINPISHICTHSHASVDDVQPSRQASLIPQIIKYSNVDSVIALFGAFLVNCSILIVASASFHGHGDRAVAEIQDAYDLIGKYLGHSAGIAFAVALLFAGQSSSVTGLSTQNHL